MVEVVHQRLLLKGFHKMKKEEGKLFFSNVDSASIICNDTVALIRDNKEKILKLSLFKY